MTLRELYFNHAGTSWPKPRLVSDAVREATCTPPSLWPQRFDEAHQAIGEYFGVSQPEQILLTPGCTSALTIGIDDSLIENGQRVLTSSWEHHALHRPLLKRAAAGVRLDYIPRQENLAAHVVDLDWLEKELAKNDVGLVALTAACNVTGELLPYEQVIQMTRKHGTMTLIDAAQIVGWRQLDFARLGADLVAFGGHKGLQAPWGVGGLYLSDRARMECMSANCELPSTGGRRSEPRPGYCDVGSVDQFALAGLHASVRTLRGENHESHLENGRSQIARIRGVLQQFDQIQLFGPPSPERTMPTLALAVKGISSSVVAAVLKRYAIIVGSGLHCAPLAHQTMNTQSSGLVRISVGLGQPDDEIDEAIERLSAVIRSEF